MNWWSMAASGARRGRGKDFDTSSASLKDLEADETLVVQSGKPVAIIKTHTDAPRVLIANSNLVPHWATWDHFNELDKKGLAMYGQMTAGSWIYIGTQGIVQGTYETFAEAGRQHYGGDLTGKWILTGGLGRHGRRAAAGRGHGGGLLFGGRVQPGQHRFPPAHPLLDEKAETLDEALGDDRPLDQGGRGEVGRSAGQCGRDVSRVVAPRRPPRYRHRPDQRA